MFVFMSTFFCQHIIARLIVEYPQQCIWQSIAVLRAHNQSKDRARYSRAIDIYKEAMRLSNEVTTLVPHIAYLSAMLIRIANDRDKEQLKLDTTASISGRYPFLDNYFTKGTIDNSIYSLIV